MIKINSKFGIAIFLFVLLHSCLTEKASVNQIVFGKKFSCDSIVSHTYDFILEEDSTLYSSVIKEPFNFKLHILEDYIKINKAKYYYLLGGINIDTLGLLDITDDLYMYRLNKSSEENAVLFNFKKDLKDSWQIKEKGYFNNYEVVLESIKYNKALKDTVYSFNYNFLGKKFPNGYYFTNFHVSKQYGVLSFSFTNGVKCEYIIE